MTLDNILNHIETLVGGAFVLLVSLIGIWWQIHSSFDKHRIATSDALTKHKNDAIEALATARQEVTKEIEKELTKAIKPLQDAHNKVDDDMRGIQRQIEASNAAMFSKLEARNMEDNLRDEIKGGVASMMDRMDLILRLLPRQQ